MEGGGGVLKVDKQEEYFGPGREWPSWKPQLFPREVLPQMAQPRSGSLARFGLWMVMQLYGSGGSQSHRVYIRFGWRQRHHLPGESVFRANPPAGHFAIVC